MSIGHYNIIYTDLDGTLLEDKFRHYKCYCDIIHKFGGIVLDITDFWENKRNKVPRNILLEKSKFAGSYEDYFTEWVERIEQPEYLEKEILKPRIFEVLDYLRQHCDKLVLVSMRKNRNNLLNELTVLGIRDYFDDIIIGSVLNGQTKADLVKKVEELKCLVLGDTEDDQMLAEKLSCDFIAVTNGLRDKQYLVAERMVKELYELL